MIGGPESGRTTRRFPGPPRPRPSRGGSRSPAPSRRRLGSCRGRGISWTAPGGLSLSGRRPRSPSASSCQPGEKKSLARQPAQRDLLEIGERVADQQSGDETVLPDGLEDKPGPPCGKRHDAEVDLARCNFLDDLLRPPVHDAEADVRAPPAEFPHGGGQAVEGDVMACPEDERAPRGPAASRTRRETSSTRRRRAAPSPARLRPAAVRRIPRPARSKRRAPKSSSKSLICRLKAGWVQCRLSAAARMLPVSTTARNVRSASRSIQLSYHCERIIQLFLIYGLLA